MTTTTLQIGSDYIGVGVGALILNDRHQFLMSLRGPQARNERGKWEIPGGKVEYGETLVESLKREIKEETGVEIEVVALLQVADHIIKSENQHWVSPTYVCRVISGTPQVMEPGKCVEMRWFTLEEAENVSLSLVTQQDIQEIKRRGGIDQLLAALQ